MLHEIDCAFSEGGTIIPIMIGDVELTNVLKYYLCRDQFYHLSENPTDDEIDKIIDAIGHKIISQQN